MTTLFGGKTGWINKTLDLPKKSRSSKFTYIIGYYGNVLNKDNWKTIRIPIDNIVEIKPSVNGYNKIQICYKNTHEYIIDMFNKIEFE